MFRNLSVSKHIDSETAAGLGFVNVAIVLQSSKVELKTAEFQRLWPPGKALTRGATRCTKFCPHCGKAFTIDEAGYADILKQVRDTDFEKQLHERLELADREKQRAIELAETKAAGELQRPRLRKTPRFRR